MKPSVYIETTIVSYLTAWPSQDVVRLAQEILTRHWWANARDHFELWTSELVLQEAARGDPKAAADRLAALAGLPLVSINAEVSALAQHMALALKLPKRAGADAVHLAAAVIHRNSFLLTWNCRHLANAVLADKIQKVCESHGHKSPRIVTPQQLMGST